MATPKIPLTATQVRDFGRANPAFVAQFTEHDQRAFAKGARGRLPDAVRKAAPKAMGRAKFTEGTPKTVPLVVKVNGRKVTKHVPETEARKMAGSVAGSRGPLSAKALLAAAENYKG